MTNNEVIIKIEISSHISDQAILLIIPPRIFANKNLGEIIKNCIERQQQNGLDVVEFENVQPMFRIKK